jgi:transcriptional regulator with XRE-family HTH domain
VKRGKILSCLEFGSRLKSLRESIGLTQNDLANKLHTARSTITLYENGKNEPDFKTLIKIADLFNVSTDYLLGRTNERYNLNLLNENNKDLLLKLFEAVNEYKIIKK